MKNPDIRLSPRIGRKKQPEPPRQLQLLEQTPTPTKRPKPRKGEPRP